MLAAAGDSAEEPIPVAIETPRGSAGRGAAREPAGRSTRSTRWRWPGIGSARRCRARRAITSMRWRWRTSCAPTRTCTGCCPTTARWPARSPCSPAPIRTRCGGAPSWCRSCGPGCASTTPASWPRSPPVRLGRGLSTTQLASADARAVLAIAPSPAEGLTVSKARVETALRRGGRQRRITSLAAASSPRCGFRSCARSRWWSRRCAPKRWQCSACLNAVCASAEQLAAALAAAFRAAPGLRDHHQLPRPGRHQRRDRARRDR